MMKPALISQPSERLTVEHDGDWLVARFASPQRVVSWAIVGGGIRRASTVAWLRVRDGDLRPPTDERELLRDRLAMRGLSGAVGLMTSADVGRYTDESRVWGEHRARAIVTVGLGNALRAGDPPGPAARIGTINVLCAIDTPLTDEALLEAMALATEARALAVREADIASRRTGLPSSGTGTDCVAIAAPDAPGMPAARYAGKHTELGHLIGATVVDAVTRGIAAWRRATGAPL
jgi:adenosylcobinamide amidohydrolase